MRIEPVSKTEEKSRPKFEIEAIEVEIEGYLIDLYLLKIRESLLFFNEPKSLFGE